MTTTKFNQIIANKLKSKNQRKDVTGIYFLIMMVSAHNGIVINSPYTLAKSWYKKINNKGVK